jgi:diguanylate cyclase (GGDEF)-like protein/PAS domain S-box-containing protein
MAGSRTSVVGNCLPGDVEDRREVEEALRRSEARLLEAQQLAKLGSWEWDVRANVVTWSDELFRIYGLEPQSLQPSYEDFLERVHPDDREDVDARNHKAFADHQPFEDVKRVTKPDGTVFLMRTQGEVICDDEGNPLRMVGVCEDVTAQVRAREAESKLAQIVESSNDAIYTITREGRVGSWNPSAQRMFGYTAAEAVGEPAAVLLAHHSAAACERQIEAVLEGERVEPFETTLMASDRCLVEVSLSLSPLHSPARESIDGVSVIARDNTERKRLERQLRHLADHDGLTGLYNRRRFDEELGRAMANAMRFAESAAVLLIDIDDFKYVNDTLGHAAGDELLRSIAAMIQQRVRATDVLARVGGDEFALLLPRAGAEEARRVAADLVQAGRDHVLALGGGLLHVTVSVGAVAFDATSAAGENVLIAADRAMYEAKAQGRDRYVVFTDVTTSSERAQMPWEQRIRHALDNDGFELHCQPIQTLAGGGVAHYELLLRLREHDGSLTYPGSFLGVAERLGLIHAIDRWVVTQAITLVAAHPGVTFAVNVSGASMDDHDLLTLVRRELEDAGADPSRLVFEITETATIARMDDARRFAQAVTELGCQLAIDDFGTGFGSFFYLKHLPVSYLKIDGDFIASPRSRTDELVIEAIVGMARGLGKRTVAEFVGDDETIAMLTALGVDLAQGYHVGRPFPTALLQPAGAPSCSSKEATA